MEIEIDSKKNNPLLNRTEVHFTIQHEGEKTPNREIIRSELAEKLNAKKENIIINDIQSSSGIQKSIGYAKIYPSVKKAEEMERKHILKRNKISGKKEKKEGEKKPEEKSASAEEPPKEEKPSEEPPKEEETTEPEEKKE
jgi:small subunit ribosomal protein S24e